MKRRCSSLLRRHAMLNWNFNNFFSGCRLMTKVLDTNAAYFQPSIIINSLCIQILQNNKIIHSQTVIKNNNFLSVSEDNLFDRVYCYYFVPFFGKLRRGVVVHLLKRVKRKQSLQALKVGIKKCWRNKKHSTRRLMGEGESDESMCGRNNRICDGSLSLRSEIDCFLFSFFCSSDDVC